MSNSSLVSYTKLSPNYSSGRGGNSIYIFTPHCVVGQVTVERLGEIFAKPARQASSNYGIGKDGRVALYVDEKNRSWCTSSKWNDQRAITVECASDATAPYAFKEVVFNRLIDLLVDCCQRNGKNKVLWFGDKNKSINYKPKSNEMLLTVHRWFDNRSCIPVESELLTKNGWVKLSDIQVGDEVASADLDNLNITFEEVYDKVEDKRQDTYTCRDLTATKDHRMVYRTQYNKKYRVDFYNNLLNDCAPNKNYIPLAGTSNFEGLSFSEEMESFLIATQADGHYMYDKKADGEKGYYGVEFHFRKERKIERIKDILEALHFPYKETNQSDGSTKIRVYNFDNINIVNDICEKYLKDKCFTWDWLMMSPEQAEFFLSEILEWDGCQRANSYCSKQKINLDVVNAIAAINNVGSRVVGDEVQFRDTPYMTLSCDVKRNNHVSKTTVSCVSVKTGLILIRQNGKTFVVGNCPGDWMYSRMGKLADEANKRLQKQPTPTPTPPTPTPTEDLYRVRLTWDDKGSQKGAFKDYDNAKKCADANPGYSVFNSKGECLYTSPKKEKFKVRVTINDLNIRAGAGTNYPVVGVTGKGVFTIVETSPGQGSVKGWGKLLSGKGWISLDYCTRL